MARRKKLPTEPVEVDIENLSHDGRGVAHVEGKTVFVDGALPGERVVFYYTAKRRHFDEAKADTIIKPSEDRVEPRCEHFGLCGGCSLQHLETHAQIKAKQNIMLDNMQRIGKVSPQHILAPLQSDVWQYRTKARLGVRYVKKKEQVMVGFRERRSSFVTNTQRCDVLHASVGLRITDLRELVESLSIKTAVPQIEVAVGDQQTCLIFRIMEPLSSTDRDKLSEFAALHDIALKLQPGGPDTVHDLNSAAPVLFYDLPEWDLRLEFGPQDFTQVNMSLNRRMIAQALDLLALTPEDRVLDLYCGLGNFSLPMARQAAHIVGVEGAAEMVRRAADNARLNRLNNLEFYTADLLQPPDAAVWAQKKYHKVLLDPPRSGAETVLDWLPKSGAGKILYVSCNPATLARDAGVLVEQHGYTLTHAGVMDMFPHTAHVESMALFER